MQATVAAVRREVPVAETLAATASRIQQRRWGRRRRRWTPSVDVPQFSAISLRHNSEVSVRSFGVAGQVQAPLRRQWRRVPLVSPIAGGTPPATTRSRAVRRLFAFLKQAGTNLASGVQQSTIVMWFAGGPAPPPTMTSASRQAEGDQEGVDLVEGDGRAGVVRAGVPGDVRCCDRERDFHRRREVPEDSGCDRDQRPVIRRAACRAASSGFFHGSSSARSPGQKGAARRLAYRGAGFSPVRRSGRRGRGTLPRARTRRHRAPRRPAVRSPRPMPC